MRRIIFPVAFLMMLCSCNTKGSGEKYVKESVGAINSLSLVMDNELWNTEVGDEVRKYFAAPVDGLPWEEPVFSIRQIPVEVFNGIARSGRNILLITKDSAAFSITENVYAKPQKIARIQGEDSETLIKLIRKHAPEIVAEYKEQEIKEKQRRIKIAPGRETGLEEKLGISLIMPTVYEVVKQEDNFFWIERKIRNGTTNIIVYTLPLDAIPDNSGRVEAIVKMRDSIGERYIPGREEGMYMITEKAYAPYIFEVELAGNEAIETRGMWEMKNFFMAGPFLNYIVKDEAHNRLLVLEGFTFAPSTNKRDFMFELEAILKSLEIVSAPQKKKETNQKK